MLGTPEEDVVALVVEGGNLAALEGGVLVEQGCQHSAKAVPQPRVKVVQHQLRLRPRRPSVSLFLATHTLSNRGNFPGFAMRS